MQFGYLALFILGIFVDQFTKILAVKKLMPIGTYPIIDGVFHFTYVENTGAAFSILRDRTYILLIVSAILMAFMAYIWFFEVRNSNYVLLKLSVIMIMIGGFGNIIDRIRLGYVIDFLDFRLINFPVFNIADCFVVMGVSLYIIMLIFNEKLRA